MEQTRLTAVHFTSGIICLLPWPMRPRIQPPDVCAVHTETIRPKRAYACVLLLASIWPLLIICIYIIVCQQSHGWLDRQIIIMFALIGSCMLSSRQDDDATERNARGVRTRPGAETPRETRTAVEARGPRRRGSIGAECWCWWSSYLHLSLLALLSSESIND